MLDFGVAKLSPGEQQDRSDGERTVARSELTTAGSAIGTISYMSPEQARGQELDARSDLFSFGLVLLRDGDGPPGVLGPDLGGDLRRDPDEDTGGAVAAERQSCRPSSIASSARRSRKIERRAIRRRPKSGPISSD